jgi:glycine dehydrogenase
MLLDLGYPDLDTFIKAVVPANILIKDEIERSLPAGVSEVEAIAEIKKIAPAKIARSINVQKLYDEIIGKNTPKSDE